MNNFKAIMCCNTAIGVIAFSTVAYGQTEAEPSALESAQKSTEGTAGIADIVVTAQRRSESINRVPISVSVVTGEQMRQLGVRTVADLARVVPGFQASNTGVQNVYTLRGVGFYDNTMSSRGSVALYIDEVGLPFSVLSPLATFDNERVEVLKGPQGTLFGQSSTGGAVNYIAAKPTSEFSAGINGSYGSYSRGNVEGFVSGPLGSNLKARIAVKQEFGQGWQRSYTRNDRLGQVNNTSGRLLVDWTPSERLRFELNLTAYTNDSDPQAPQYLQTILLSPTPASIAAVTAAGLNPYISPPRGNKYADWTPTANFFQRNEIYLASLRSEFDISDAIKLTALTSYSHFTQNAYRPADGTAPVNDLFKNKGRNRVFQQELRLSGSLDSGFQWVAGAFYGHDRAVQEDQTFTPITATAAYAYDGLLPSRKGGNTNSVFVLDPSVTTTKALFGDVTLPVSETITLRGGGRYTWFKGHSHACVIGADMDDFTRFGINAIVNFRRSQRGLAPIAPAARGECTSYTNELVYEREDPTASQYSLNEHNLSWRASVDWRFTPGSMLYATVSRGYKSGSFPIVPAAVASQFEPAKQERLQNYELGIKSSLANRTIQINAAIFHYDYSNKQFLGRVLDPFLGSLTRLINIPKAKETGVEAQVTWAPSPQFRMTVAGTYLDSKIKSFQTFNALAQPINIGGEKFPFTPKYQGNIDAQFTQPLGDGDISAYAGASADYHSKTNASFGKLAFLAIKDYATLDLRVGLSNSAAQWNVGLYARNVTNSYYWTNAIRAIDTVVRFTGMPRTYGINFSKTF